MMNLSETQINWAGANTLNTIAFDSRNEGIPDQLGKDLKTRRNTRSSNRRAAFFEVNKASNKAVEAALVTKRGWLKYHVEEGQRTPTPTGFEYRGKKYILVPYKEQFFKRVRRRPVIKSTVRKGLVVIPYSNTEALLFYRPRRGGNKELQLVAFLVSKAQFKKDFNWVLPIENKFKKDVTRLLHANLDHQHRRVRK